MACDIGGCSDFMWLTIEQRPATLDILNYPLRRIHHVCVSVNLLCLSQILHRHMTHQSTPPSHARPNPLRRPNCSSEPKQKMEEVLASCRQGFGDGSIQTGDVRGGRRRRARKCIEAGVNWITLVRCIHHCSYHSLEYWSKKIKTQPLPQEKQGRSDGCEPQQGHHYASSDPWEDGGCSWIRLC